MKSYFVERSANCRRVGLHDLLLAPPQAERPQDRAVVLTRARQTPLQCDNKRPDRRLHARID